MMFNNNSKEFKANIQNGHLSIGCDITFSDPEISEIYAAADYDFIWIDMEHNPLSLKDVEGHIIAVHGTDTAAIVRVPWNDPILMKPVLELAPAGIVIPMVKTAAEADLAVKSCKYPPKGIRGFGPRRGNLYGKIDTFSYLEQADDQTMVLIQIEHKDAVENLDAILATPGLDGICIGPMDLSASLGCLGQMDHPDLIKAINIITEKVMKTDIFYGVSCGYLGEGAKEWLDRGVQWISYSTDANNLFAAASKHLRELKNLHTKKA